MIDKNVEKKAKKIIIETKITNVPISLEKIAKHYSIFVTEIPSKDELSGLLLKSENKTIIGINANHGESRKRFTIAHELGHYFLHQNEDTFVDESENLEMIKFRHRNLPQSEKEEKEANNFAAAILMPAGFLKKHFKLLNEVLKVDEVIQLLSEKYEVSSVAMRYRLINLQLINNQ